MTYHPFSEEWIQQFSDPYAVLGVSISADDRRVLRRFRSIAKLLHPDSLRDAPEEDQQFANQLFAKVVNQNYQRLKQEKGRAEVAALLRSRVRRLAQTEPLNPQGKQARRIWKMAVADVEIYYEQAIAQLSDQQYHPLSNFEAITQEMAELNLVYLRLKMGEPMILEKRTGLVAASPSSSPPKFVFPSSTSSTLTERQSVSYAERHYQRAQEYIRKGNYQTAVQELKDAIRIDCDQSRYHALMAHAYLRQNLPGAAKAYCRKALKLDAGDRIAMACAKRLKINVEDPDQGKQISSKTNHKASTNSNSKSGGFFGLFSRKR
jgi:curved DNA-binding protein CbpA